MNTRDRKGRLPVELPVPQLIKVLAERFMQAGIPAPQAEAEWLFAAILKVKRSALYLEQKRTLSHEQLQILENFFQRRLQREPLQYILGNCEFYGREFQVSPAVLIPRPETELLVERAIKLIEGRTAPRVIDLGTGSGCIAVTLALELADAQISATDIAEEALHLARENARRWKVYDRVEFLHEDMCKSTYNFSPFDVIVSNPPYVLETERAELQPEVRDYEPDAALFVEADGLKFYRGILEFCQRHLKPGGWVACEMAAQRSAAIRNMFEETSVFTSIEIVHDYAGMPRHIIAQRRLR